MQDFPDAQAKVSTTCWAITALARNGIFAAGDKRARSAPERINMTLSMAFVAPAIVKAAIEGRRCHLAPEPKYVYVC
jgi:hypothetical protein